MQRVVVGFVTVLTPSTETVCDDNHAVLIQTVGALAVAAARVPAVANAPVIPVSVQYKTLALAKEVCLIRPKGKGAPPIN